MPTFSPKSEARGRTLEGVFWATVAAVIAKTAATTRSVFVIASDYICRSRLWTLEQAGQNLYPFDQPRRRKRLLAAQQLVEPMDRTLLKRS
jgi:hypothetical protein